MFGAQFQELTDLSNKVETKKQDFQLELNKLRQANEELKGAWKGPDADLYQRKANEQAEKIQKFINSLGELGESIMRTKNAYEAAQNENLNNI